jgi:hypothetical protein
MRNVEAMAKLKAAFGGRWSEVEGEVTGHVVCVGVVFVEFDAGLWMARCEGLVAMDACPVEAVRGVEAAGERARNERLERLHSTLAGELGPRLGW